MIFKIDYSLDLERKVLIYREEEYSFDMYPWSSHVAIDFDIVVNKITMTVVDCKIIQLNGFCGLTSAMKSDIKTPSYKSGALIIKDRLEQGFAYDICKEDLPIRLNTKTGWVCIGNPYELGEGVEFIENCVAVISNNGKFLSLWLRPTKLPKL